MLDSIKQFFTEKMEITESSQPDHSHRLAIATGAILLEIAKTDREFEQNEQDTIVELLKKQFQLADNDVSEILELAEKERKQSLDLWQFSNLINENYSNLEKEKLLEMIWQVAFADGRIDKYEDYLIRKFTSLLHMSHSDMINSKLIVKNKMNKE